MLYVQEDQVIGACVRIIRKQRKISSDFMAKELEISLSSYCRYEIGEVSLTVPRLLLILDILSVDPPDFFATRYLVLNALEEAEITVEDFLREPENHAKLTAPVILSIYKHYGKKKRGSSK